MLYLILGHWGCLTALDCPLTSDRMSLQHPGHCLPSNCSRILNSPQSGQGFTISLYTDHSTMWWPKTALGQPCHQPAPSHIWREELQQHPSPAGSGDGRHCKTTPPCPQDKTDAKETKAEEIQELRYMIQLSYLSQGELMRNEITEVTP